MLGTNFQHDLGSAGILVLIDFSIKSCTVYSMERRGVLWYNARTCAMVTG